MPSPTCPVCGEVYEADDASGVCGRDLTEEINEKLKIQLPVNSVRCPGLMDVGNGVPVRDACRYCGRTDVEIRDRMCKVCWINGGETPESHNAGAADKPYQARVQP